jgi:flagella basal body P-ring formation protein FlgA
MRHTKLFFFLSVLLLTGQSIADTNKFDSAFVEQFAKNYLTEQFPSTETERISISVAKLDPRIIIKACNVPLTANIPEKSQARNVNVKISCDESTPWQMYLSAKIEKTKAVLIAKATISKGDILTEDNIELAHIAVNKIRGDKLTDTNIIYGAKAKKRIAQGRAISKKSICLVCKGDVVTIIALSNSFSIKTQGVALSSANVNEQIRVKNSRSNKVITPRVQSANKVVIHL